MQMMTITMAVPAVARQLLCSSRLVFKALRLASQQST
jgi:hypothetical protein